jgi:hypothetical protein
MSEDVMSSNDQIYDSNNENYENNFSQNLNIKSEEIFNNNIISQNPIKQYPQLSEEQVVWELEVWKRAEQTKFKAYLKGLEFEFLSKLSEDYKLKEEEHEKEIKSKINELNTLQTRVKKKASELEGRESKLMLMEGELKSKINEVARQLTNKDEEIIYLQKRFKENKNDLEKEKLNLVKQLQEKDKEYKILEENFGKFKKEIDESPLSVLKHELNKKSLELEEQVRDRDRINEEKEKYKSQCEKLKMELIKMKKLFEQEKESLYKQKIDEIEKLKFEIYNQKISQNEISELQELRNKIKSLSDEKESGIKEKDSNNNFNLPPQNSNYGNFVSQNQTKKKEYKIVSIPKRNKSENFGNTFNVRTELEKLNQERYNLINSGMYHENDNLIIQIDNRIRRLQEMEY